MCASGAAHCSAHFVWPPAKRQAFFSASFFLDALRPRGAHPCASESVLAHDIFFITASRVWQGLLKGEKGALDREARPAEGEEMES